MLLAIVDDSTTNLRVYVNIVSQIPGVTTKTFQSSADAFEWCRLVEPDLLVLDYNMPAPNGVEFIKRYRKVRPAAQTPIIMITGEQDREVRHEALMAGASDFVSKPADPVEFLTRVRNLLATVQSRRAFEATFKLESASHEIELIHRLMRAVEYRDDRSGTHVIRMGLYAALISKNLPLAPEEQRLYALAAPMHDVGKVAVNDAILQKRGTLTENEWEMVHRHPAAGHMILSGSEMPALKVAATMALGHHERWNGTGYPSSLIGDRIPLAARVCAVADAFDAILTERPYKRMATPDVAFAELQRLSGVYYDPAVVLAAFSSEAAMIEVATEHPAAAVIV